jgi:hypothetical protein
MGYRHYRLDDRLNIGEQLTSPLFVAGTVLSLDDRFTTRNSFHGLELGLIHTERVRTWEIDGFAKIALGWNAATVQRRGQTRVDSPIGSRLVYPAGLYVLESNSGCFDDTDFTAVLQIGTNLAYHLTENCLLRVGYTFLFWPDVFRAGDQIDTTINPNLLPPSLSPIVGPWRPAAQQHDSDFWAQGVNLGLECRF